MSFLCAILDILVNDYSVTKKKRPSHTKKLDN